MLTGKKILVTGVTGVASRPIAEFLARDNEVWGVARFTNQVSRLSLEAKGIITRTVDFERGELDDLPDDFTHLLLCAHARFGPQEFQRAIEVNAMSAGRVMTHCKRAEAAVIFSSGSIYSINDKEGYYPFKERDDIGRAFPPWASTSPISKASLEAVARICAEIFGIRTMIARLNIVYGPAYGMPFKDAELVHAGEEIVSFADPYPANVIHSDDMCAQIEAMFDAASIPARIVNWAGDDVVTRHDWIEHSAKLLGVPASIKVAPVPGTPPGSVLDTTLLRSITGPCKMRFWDAFDEILVQGFAKEASIADG